MDREREKEEGERGGAGGGGMSRTRGGGGWETSAQTTEIGLAEEMCYSLLIYLLIYIIYQTCQL